MYIELHTRSAFTFLEGAALPEDLATAAARLDLPAIALLDRDGVYGVPRFHLKAKQLGIRAHIGAEISVEEPSLQSELPEWLKNSFPSPSVCYPLLAKTRTGYKNLCRLITQYKMRAGKKGGGRATLAELQGHTAGLVCLTGGEEGPLAAALARGGYEVGKKAVEKLCAIYGKTNVYVELQRHGNREEESRNQAAVQIAEHLKLSLVATNGVRYILPKDREILDVLTCIKNHCQLETAQRTLEKNDHRHLRTQREMERQFADLPCALANTRDLSLRLDFTLSDLEYEFPKYPVPSGQTMMSFLCRRTKEGFVQRYCLKKDRCLFEQARRQVARELKLIENLHLEGYFLIVWDIVRFCQEMGILVQGRGSAANSAVCYSLGITAVDPVGMGLLFERFLSEQRGEWPDIDLDLPSGDDRERVIQYVYQRYGKLGAAMTSNVITYRDRSAIREVGKVLGFDLNTQNQLSSLTGTWEWKDSNDTLKNHFYQTGLDPQQPKIAKYLELCQRMQGLPRHLGQHSGGMVICQGQLNSVVPLEPAAMPGRVVVQWDKDDCANMGIVKVDLLGLGMMAVIKDCLQLIPQHYKVSIDLAQLPPNDPIVFKALQQADTVGMFQVESRAQMSALPRNHPTRFYDLVVQVALIRPGPIVGRMMHPYLKRRQKKEAVHYVHPALEPILKRTLGVPLFQEQLLRIAMTVANFSGGEAEELRRTLGSQRSQEKMRKIELNLRTGMSKNEIPKETQDKIVLSITSFSRYGFPESHAASFALITYASAYFKCHYLAAFTASLLNNQPMGFYSSATIIKDAQRHGLKVKAVDVLYSNWLCKLEKDSSNGVISLRLGLNQVRGLPKNSVTALVEQRKYQEFASLEDLVKRIPELRVRSLRMLALIGALNSITPGLNRRDMLWQVERVTTPLDPLFSKDSEEDMPSPLYPMTNQERLVSDFYGVGLTIGPHPISYSRKSLNEQRVLRAIDLKKVPHGQTVHVGGSVIARQRPRTAKGFVFLSLEDETGISNIIVPPDIYEKHHLLISQAAFLLVEGMLQHQEGVVSVKALHVKPLRELTAQIKFYDSHYRCT